MRSATLILLFLLIAAPVFSTEHPWLEQIDHSLHFKTGEPAQAAKQFSIHSIEMPNRVTTVFLAGNFLNNGSEQIAYYVPETNALELVDIQSQEKSAIHLNPFPFDADLENMRYVLTQQIGYDGVPGQEILFTMAKTTRPFFAQIVSPVANAVIQTVSTSIRDDVDGDGVWNGNYNVQEMFPDKKGRWKLATVVSTSPRDFKPRALQIYDVETETLEDEFHVAGGVLGYSSIKTPDNERFLLLAPFSPANGVTELLEEVETNDQQAYAYAFQAMSDAAPDERMKLIWHQRRVDLTSGRSSTSTDANGRPLAIVNDSMIRVFDPISAGLLHVYDMATGEIINEFSAGEELSYLYAGKAEQSDSLYTILQEEPRILKYDIYNGLQAEARFPANISYTLRLLAIADMNGDGKVEALLNQDMADDPKLLILDQDLNVMETVPMDSIIRNYSLADHDNDGYPEIYLLNHENQTTMTILEYQAGSSSINEFNAYQ